MIRKLRIRPSSFGVALVAFGLLLWARLLLLTGHPKMAIAEPSTGHSSQTLPTCPHSADASGAKQSEATPIPAAISPERASPVPGEATHSPHAGD
ncbi:MAG: hypothetical protein K2X32_13465 [Phycisphaerales bacterium]|nr:hypothetical protein [Phycisphaerales bacterium]